jgi:pimeloyl-ACP methyl ester carboxylesterase
MWIYGAVSVVALSIAGTLAAFFMWRRQYSQELNTQSVVIQTACGPVEYAEIGDGFPLLLVHGTPGGFDEPLNYIKATHGDDYAYRYIMPSRPGYLRTPLSVGETPEKQAQAFAALLTKLGIDKVAVIASSGGGPSGWQFALQFPERCCALVLEEAVTQTHADNPAQLKSSIFRDYLVWLFGGIRIAQWQATNPSDRNISKIGKVLLNSIGLSKLRTIGEANDFVQFAQIGSPPLHRIECPTLILHGGADKHLPIAHSEIAHSQIKRSEFVILPGADHFMPITKYKELHDLEYRFVSQCIAILQASKAIETKVIRFPV